MGLLAALLALSGAALPFDAAAAGREVRRSATGEPSTLDPQLWTYGQDGNIAQDLFQGLTTLDAAARPVAGQAESWSVSPDGLSYRFRLRRGLTWSDGVPLDARDFLWSFRRLFDPRTAAPSASLLFMIRGAREVATGRAPPERLAVAAPDPLTLTLELEHPAPNLVDLLVHRAFPVPRHVVEKWGREWTRPGRLVSNGAFVLGEWRPGSHVRLDRNPRFHQSATVRLDAVFHVPVEDAGAALRRYRAGELDVVVTLPSEQIPALRREFGPQLRLVRQIGLEYLAFNTRRPPLDDARVRRALSMALEREVLSARVLQGGEPAAYCVVPPGVENYPRGACADFGAWPATRRQQEARQLLAAAGHGPGKPLTLRLRHPNSDTQRRVALALAAMWQPLGVRAELVNADLRAHQQALQQGDFDVARAAWYAEDRDAASFLALLDSRAGPLNLSRFADPAYDALLDRATSSADLAARAALLAEAEGRATRQQPIAPLYVYVSRRLVSPRVQGWVDNPRGVHLDRYLEVAPR
ncbi:MAG: peptide ABC transporter substrate-binding protein [Steroidobacteraceae bacterium]|nr:peptide ABC transporter substrate-binding protein [Steroidobacteraceae bacterium]